jgi:hypothetical protein
MLTHYCYIVQASGFVKIGYTVNLDARLENIQTSCPFEVSVVCLFPYAFEVSAREMETSLHKQFEQFRVRGEWFRKKQVLKILRSEGKKI